MANRKQDPAISKAKRLASQARYNEKNKELVKERQRLYRRSVAGKRHTKEWIEANPEKVKASKQKGDKKAIAKKREYVREYKLAHPCACGVTYPACLDFDHRVPAEKLFCIGAGIGNKSMKSLKLEMEKCDILCGNCHRRKTALNNDRTREYKIKTYTKPAQIKRQQRQKVKRVTRWAAAKKLITEYKLIHPCVDCGESDPLVLDFDHRDPAQKLYNISQIITGEKKKLLNEIAKCDIRCCNCHRKKTYDEQQNLVKVTN